MKQIYKLDENNYRLILVYLSDKILGKSLYLTIESLYASSIYTQMFTNIEYFLLDDDEVRSFIMENL